jgi:hypothetical protein
MFDDDKIRYLNNFRKSVDKNNLNYFFEGATEYMEYQDAEKFAGACIHGILRALQKLKTVNDDEVHSDMAVIAVLLVGAYMRQAKVDSPESKLLTDIREAIHELNIMNNRKPSNDSD